MDPRNVRGSIVALVTPFARDGSVDEAALKKLVEFQIENGTDAISPCGTTGEAVTLSDEEYERVISVVVESVDRRVPVIAGAGSNCTEKAIKFSKTAKKAGADGLLHVGPYYNKPTQEGYYQHFRAIAESVDLPILLYNVPGRTGGNILPKTVLRLAEVPNIYAIKEASGNLPQMMELLGQKPEDFRVYSGDDAFTLALVALGGDGIVSVAANEAPGPMKQFVDAALQGDFARARELHYNLLPLMDINFVETNPIPVKCALAMMGLIEENYRLPMVPIGEENRKKVRAVLQELRLI